MYFFSLKSENHNYFLFILASTNKIWNQLPEVNEMIILISIKLYEEIENVLSSDQDESDIKG